MKSLTKQEKRVLEQISDGYSTAKIAEALQISLHTVETHRKSLLAKLDAGNAAELVKKAIHANLLSSESDTKNYKPYTS